MGYKMKGFTYPGEKQSPLAKVDKQAFRTAEKQNDFSGPGMFDELQRRATSGISFMRNRYKKMLDNVMQKRQFEGGGSGGGSSAGKHGDEMHTGTEAEMQKGKKFETGPAPKPITPGEAPENKKEE